MAAAGVSRARRPQRLEGGCLLCYSLSPLPLPRSPPLSRRSRSGRTPWCGKPPPYGGFQSGFARYSSPKGSGKILQQQLKSFMERQGDAGLYWGGQMEGSRFCGQGFGIGSGRKCLAQHPGAASSDAATPHHCAKYVKLCMRATGPLEHMHATSQTPSSLPLPRPVQGQQHVQQATGQT